MTIGFPGVHGVGVAGTHGIGVNTPRAALVAAATVGFARELHIPKGATFIMGTWSMMVAMGRLTPFTFFAGRIDRAPGATPKVHEHNAPFTTS
jgi:hypothetical protein